MCCFAGLSGLIFPVTDFPVLVTDYNASLFINLDYFICDYTIKAQSA